MNENKPLTLREKIIEHEILISSMVTATNVVGVTLKAVPELKKEYAETLVARDLEQSESLWYFYMRGYISGVRSGAEMMKNAAAVDARSRQQRVRRQLEPRDLSNLWGILPR